MTSPYRPTPTVVPGTAAHRLIRGAMRMESRERHIERVDLYEIGAWSVGLVDTGNGDAASWSSAGDTTFHILWQANEDDGWIDADSERYPVVPGDTMSVPAGAGMRLAAGMLIAQIRTVEQSLGRVLPPSHGVESFEGYNRRTEYETPDAFVLHRWKITQPLTVPTADEDYVVIDLAVPLAMAWPGGTDLIGRGECRVVPAGAGPVTLLPDGLGYALVIR